MKSGSQDSAFASRDRAFATTRWSIVISAGCSPSLESRDALALLCETYWSPLYAYVRRRVPDVATAQDLTQAFFAELLEKNFVGSATPARGKFRAFLITAFKHFLSREWEKAKAQKRGGGRVPLSLNFASVDSEFSIDPPGGLSAEQLYDRQWAIALLGQVMERLRLELERSGKSQQFLELKEFLIGHHEGVTYAEVAPRLKMTEGAAKKAVSRMRKRYRELLREEILQTVSGPEETEEEIRNLFLALQK